MPNAKEKRNKGAYENTDDPGIYHTVGVTVDMYEDLQKPTEDKFQEKRNPCRTVAVGLGLLTLLLLAGITGLGIHYFHEKTNYNKLTQRISQLEEEIAKGINCCPQNWQKFGNHCYYASTSTKTWEESKKDCEKQHAHLVIITSAEEQEFMKRLGVHGWIGLARQEDGAHWEWVDGSLLTTRYWGDHQPGEIGEDCVTLDCVNSLWHDYPCGDLRRWICKKEI